MPKVFQIYSGDDQRRLDIAESSKEFYRNESRRGSGGCWDLADGVSKRQSWKPVDLYVPNPLDAPSDIYRLNTNVLLLEANAKDALKDVVSGCGEAYDLPFENRLLYVLNVMSFIPAPLGDEDFPKDGLLYDLKHVTTSLARLPWGSVRAISGVTPPELDFKLLVEKHNLKGLSFREVWDSENYVPYVAPAEDEDE